MNEATNPESAIEAARPIDVFVSPEFTKGLEDLINTHCVENGSDTPDFILTEYKVDCLHAFNKVTNKREQWYGRKS